MEMEDKVVLLDCWASPYGTRVRIALAENGIEYEIKEEDLSDKSPLLLESNPVHKKIPVLVHNGKPICESLNIVQYINEVWATILRRFFRPTLTNDRVPGFGLTSLIRITISMMLRTKGEEQKSIVKEFIVSLKTMEEELGEKPYFGGDSFGFVDLALVPITTFFYTFETFAHFSAETECPKISEWAKRCMEKESVAKSIPDSQKIYGIALSIKEKYGF